MYVQIRYVLMVRPIRESGCGSMTDCHSGISRDFSQFIGRQSPFAEQQGRKRFSFRPAFSSQQKRSNCACAFSVPADQPFAQQPFRVRQPQPYKKCFRRGLFGHWASFIACPDFSRSLVNRVASLTPLKYSQQVTKPFRDLDQMIFLVSFLIPTLFLVVTTGDVLDRSHPDYLQDSYSVIVNGRLRVNFDFW